MAQGRPYQAYQTASVTTTNQKQLIIMLYDGMDRFLSKSVKAIKEGDIESAHTYLHRTGQILLELLSTLREDKGGEIAANLKRIYVFCYEQVVIANLKKDIRMIRGIQEVLANLRGAWKKLGAKDVSLKTGTEALQKIRVTG